MAENKCFYRMHVDAKGNHIDSGTCARCNETICSRCAGTGTEYTGAPWAMEPGPCTQCYKD